MLASARRLALQTEQLALGVDLSAGCGLHSQGQQAWREQGQGPVPAQGRDRLLPAWQMQRSGGCDTQSFLPGLQRASSFPHLQLVTVMARGFDRNS